MPAVNTFESLTVNMTLQTEKRAIGKVIKVTKKGYVGIIMYSLTKRNF